MALLDQGRPHRLDAMEGAVEMHAHHVGPFLVRHLREAAVAHVPGVGQQDIDAAIRLQRQVGQRSGLVQRRGAADGLAARLPDLMDDFLDTGRIAAMHHHGCRPAGQVTGVGPSEPGGGAGHDGDLAVEDATFLGITGGDCYVGHGSS
ncbi:MAG: hypothetical protein ABJD97_00155 [Betaproteobacteria bacterium]